MVAFLLLCREGSARGFGIRKSNSTLGSDSWVDDPITRHIIGLYINKEHKDDGDKNLLWPLILHIKGNYSILVLPLVEPRHVKAYATLCKRPTCGSSLGLDDGFSSLLLDLPSITGYANLLYLPLALSNSQKLYHHERQSLSYSLRLVDSSYYYYYYITFLKKIWSWVSHCLIG